MFQKARWTRRMAPRNHRKLLIIIDFQILVNRKRFHAGLFLYPLSSQWLRGANRWGGRGSGATIGFFEG